MQYQTFAGFLIALSCAHGALAVFSVATYLRRPRDRSALLFGLLNASIVPFEVAYARCWMVPSSIASALWVAEIAAIAGAVLVLHYALVHAEVVLRRRALGLLYGGGAFVLFASGAGLVERFGDATTAEVRVLGAALPDVHLPLGPLGLPVALLRLSAALAVAILLGRRVLRGKRDGLAFAGATALAVAVANDALHTLGIVPGPPLLPLGFAVFTMGFSFAFTAQRAATRAQFEARSVEIKRQGRELARARAELRAEREELVRKEQLAAVGELSAVIAHEVRNPLAIISNAVATLRRGDEIEPRDRETLLGILDEETNRLNRLVGDLLRYARPVALERQLVVVRELLDRALALAAGRRDLAIEVVEEGEAPRVWADASLLRQALDNLITNAVQAMASGGALTITLAPEEVAGEPGVELQIRDTGEGMDTLVRKRALDPFFTTRPSGTGLGLAIVARIIDAHGGELRIQSRAGAGTVVHVLLPVGSETLEVIPSRVEERSSDVPLPAELKRALGRR